MTPDASSELLVEHRGPALWLTIQREERRNAMSHAVLAGMAPPKELVERAWRQLLLNQAHDSAAGCGVDATHEDVKSRYRWAEQLAGVVCEQVLSALAPQLGDRPQPMFMAYSPGPAAPALVVEVEVPRALEGALLSCGLDGIEHRFSRWRLRKSARFSKGSSTAVSSRCLCRAWIRQRPCLDAT